MPQGLLDDDDGATDLATLEKKLTEKRASRQASNAVGSNSSSPSQAASGQDVNESTPHSPLTSPEPVKENKDSEKHKSLSPDNKTGEEEVEVLSEMMCSLVTNNYGETRYIGALA